MENGHSRLLKFLLPYSENMSKHTLKYEYIKPSNIESEVPGKQALREPKNDNTTEINNDGNNNKEKENFVPVLTIKKEETALTKGDFKLQKVLVTENVAEEDNSNTALVINPLYSEVQSAVISVAQPLRDTPKDDNLCDDEKDKMEVSGKDRKEKKLKTKIPTLKFKQTVEKVKRERKNSSQGQEKIKNATQGRRSSIPKLRRRRNSTSFSDDINKANTLVANKNDTNVDKPEEEFEKLYDAIVDNKVVDVVAEKMLTKKVEDPEELETSFEEIIHAYDENKIQHISIENNKSKIPLNRQRSLHKESIPKQVERRLSLRTKSIDEKEKQHLFQLTNAKTENISKIPVAKKDEPNPIVIEKDVNKEKTNASINTVKEENTSNTLNEKSISKTRQNNRSLLSPENKETSEQQLTENSDIKSIEEVNNKLKEKHPNPPSANEELVQPDDKNKVYLEYSNSKIPDSSKMVMNMFPSHDNKDDGSYKYTKSLDDVNKTVLKQGDSNDSNSNDAVTIKNNLNDSKQKRSILTKIAIFQGKIAPANKQNGLDAAKDSLELRKRSGEKENHINTEHECIKQNINESKEPLELKNNENKGITHDDQNLDEMIQNKSINISLTADLLETNGKKESTAKENIKDSNCIDDKNSDEKDFEYKTSETKRKVSDIISRIDSNDKTNLMPKKEIEIDIPKERSVFSKIAMFERQISKEPIKVNEELSTNKVKVHTIKEININDVEHRKPKIIDSVLKSQPLRKSLIEDYVADTQITSADFDITDPYKTTEEISTNEVQEIQIIESNESKILQTAETEQPFKSKPPNDKEATKTDLVSIKRGKNFDDDLTKVSKTENVDKQSLNSNIMRRKSVVEQELGETIKGKVHRMVVRMNSSEKAEVEKKEVIHIRERPRKKSVSEKIALFERKLTPVKLQSLETTTIQNVPVETKNDSNQNNHLPKSLTEEEYKKRIEELEKASEIYGNVTKIPSVELRDGRKMPVLSVGTALLDPRLIQPIIKAGIDLGYRAIDTAFIYGNEKEIGEAIKAKIDDGTVTRDDLFIVNKLWNTFHRPDLVQQACTDSLAAMQLDYFDLYLVHTPISFKEGKDVVPKIANVIQYSDYDYLDAWFGMEELVKKGLVRSIGVSNFNSQQMARIEEKAHIKPVIDQVECHPYLSQQPLTAACADRGVTLSCYGALGSKGTPNDLKSNLVPVIDDPIVQVLAAGRNVTAAQLLIRYQIDSGHLVVVKASSAAHLWNNLQALHFHLTSAELDSLNLLNKNKRTYTFKGMGDTHRNYPFKAPF